MTAQNKRMFFFRQRDRTLRDDHETYIRRSKSRRFDLSHHSTRGGKVIGRYELARPPAASPGAICSKFRSQRHLSDERNKRVTPRHLGRMPTFASPLTVAPSHAITPRHAKHRTCRTAHLRKTRLAVCQLSGCELPPHCCFILQREVGTLVPSSTPETQSREYLFIVKRYLAYLY